jgi:hypothetical protein
VSASWPTPPTLAGSSFMTLGSASSQPTEVIEATRRLCGQGRSVRSSRPRERISCMACSTWSRRSRRAGLSPRSWPRFVSSRRPPSDPRPERRREPTDRAHRRPSLASGSLLMPNQNPDMQSASELRLKALSRWDRALQNCA